MQDVPTIVSLGDSGSATGRTRPVARARPFPPGGMLKTVNPACSGASAENIPPLEAGGKPSGREQSQDGRLDQVAKQDSVRAIVPVSGNDVGFGDIIADCITASENPFGTSCHVSEQAALNTKPDRTVVLLGKAVKDIRSVMAENGYEETGVNAYRLVVQSHPSRCLAHRKRAIRRTAPWRTAGPTRGAHRAIRTSAGHGAPWFPRSRPGSVPRPRAQRRFHRPERRLPGHETCSESTIADAKNRPASAATDWTRCFSTGVFQGGLKRSFHPNACGQRALGDFLGTVVVPYGVVQRGRRVQVRPGRTDDQMSFGYVRQAVLPRPRHVGPRAGRSARPSRCAGCALD